MFCLFYVSFFDTMLNKVLNLQIFHLEILSEDFFKGFLIFIFINSDILLTSGIIMGGSAILNSFFLIYFSSQVFISALILISSE